MNQNLFNALSNLGIIALESDMHEILLAVEKDRQQEFKGINGSIFTNSPVILQKNIQQNNVNINLEIRKKKEHRNTFMISVWRLENAAMQKYLPNDRTRH